MEEYVPFWRLGGSWANAVRCTFLQRSVMLWTFVPFVISNMACALAPNHSVLIVFRLLAGTFGSSPLANAGGSVSDMWAPHERSLATSLYSAGPWFGPST